MGRLITGAQNPTVLYVSGGNTQVRLSSLSLVPIVDTVVYVSCVHVYSGVCVCFMCTRV